MYDHHHSTAYFCNETVVMYFIDKAGKSHSKYNKKGAA